MSRSVISITGYFIAGALFTLSGSLSAIALPWLVYDLTENAALMGVVAFATLCPTVLGLLCGARWVERTGLRKTALCAEWVNLLPMVAIAWLAASEELTYPMLLILTLVAASMDGFAQLAFEARWPEVARLARISIQKANFLDDMIDNLIGVLGPALAGGGIYLFGTNGLLWGIAAVSALSLLVTYLTFPDFRENKKAGYGASLMDGVQHLWQTPILKNALIMESLGVGIWTALEMVVLPAGLRAVGYGIEALTYYLSFGAFGAIAINLLFVLLKIKMPLYNLFAIAFLGFGASILLLFFSLDLPVLIVCGFICGLAVGPLSPAFYTALYTETPKHIRSFVVGVSGALLFSTAPLSVFILGVGVEYMGSEWVLMVVMASLIFISIWAACLSLLSQSIENKEQLLK